jgi:hypothetical protein
MPRGDGTGPAGFGPMTGRAAGYCAGFQMPGYANPISGRGFGMGFGRGFRGGGYGRRNMFYATGLPGVARYGAYPVPAGYSVPYQKPDPDWEKNALKNQADALRSELDYIKARLDELEKGAPEKE